MYRGVFRDQLKMLYIAEFNAETVDQLLEFYVKSYDDNTDSGLDPYMIKATQLQTIMIYTF